MYPFVYLFIIKVTFSVGGEGGIKMVLLLFIFSDINDSIHSIPISISKIIYMHCLLNQAKLFTFYIFSDSTGKSYSQIIVTVYKTHRFNENYQRLS